MMKTYRFSVVLEMDQDGYYVFCPQLQGCYTQGETYEEALENIKDAIRLHLADRVEAGEEIPQSESISLVSLEVAV
jgi:predicted RNase H-like HicB family nuclease